MFDLTKILETMASPVEKVWENAKTYGVLELSSKRDTYEWKYILGPEKVGKKIVANYEDGLYTWFYGDKVLYVGQTASPTMSIHKRQNNHLRSFVKIHEKHESSGRKYREFMKENNLQKMKIVVKYIPIDQYSENPGMMSMIESASIFHYKPLLNKEVKGNGKRS